MNPTKEIRRLPAIWLTMAALAVILLIVFGRAPEPGGTSDDRLYGIAEQLKCLQCVGESTAASQSPLAQKFRDEIRIQMVEGSSDAEILDFFSARYGDEVLLTPSATGASALIWMIPLLVVTGGAVVLVFAFRRWGRVAPVGDDVGGESSSPDQGGSAQGQARVVEAEGGESPSRTARPSSRKPPEWARPVVLGSAAVFVLILGGLLWRASNDRAGGNITGDAFVSADLRECRAAMSDMENARECYSSVLVDDPDNVEALAYRGWMSSRLGDPESATADLERAISLDPEYVDALVFSAVVAVDNGDFEAAGTYLSDFYAADPPEEMTSIVTSQQLQEKILFGTMEESARACWQDAAQDSGVGSMDQEFLDQLGRCADERLQTAPTSRDLRLAKAISLLGSEDGRSSEAVVLADSLLAEDPEDVDALSVSTVALVISGEPEEASLRLAEVVSGPRSVLAVVLGDAEQLNELIDSALRTSVPNPDGG